MAEYSTPEQRTEMPTSRRMGQLRKEGAIHMSVEVCHVVTLIAGMTLLSATWQPLYARMQLVLVKSYQMIASTEPLTFEKMYQGFIGLIFLLGPQLMVVILGVAVIASLSVMLQTDWNVKESVKFKWDQLLPWNGFGRIFSLNGLVTTLKAILKLAIILPLAYFSLKSFAPQMLGLAHLSVAQILEFTGKGIHTIFWRIMYIMIAFAIFDYIYGKWQWLRQNKMTKDEVKDERKSIEGDEETKRAIQAKGLRRIWQRIAMSVPKADVVVTNPTHYAVALKYDRDSMDAPMVVAKGQGFLAEKIKEIARASGVPVLERKPLARALYSSVEIGAIIPRELFRAVAEVLAYVYKLKNPYGQAKAGTQT
jgi:flagellar biosynthesis protein FlhB